MSITDQTSAAGCHVTRSGGRRATSSSISPTAARRRAPARSPRDSGIAAILAEELKRFLNRPIGEREQHRVLADVVRYLFPARHHEDVARLPVHREVRADAGA